MKIRNQIRNVRNTAVFLVLALPQVGFADSGDAKINFAKALSKQQSGELDEAMTLYRKACMAANGIVDACLEWAEMAKARDDDKSVKRALGSAVMVAPTDIRARAQLAAKLIKKQDYDWALEHLTQAMPHVENEADKALLTYYLAYVHFKKGEMEKAEAEFTEARPMLPPKLTQRCDYYLGIIKDRNGDRQSGVALLADVQEGEDDKWATAATDVLETWSAFKRREGVSARLSASFGINTHPASAFLDAVETDSKPVVQSVFRADLILGKELKKSGLQAVITAYREQNWAEYGGSHSSDPGGDGTTEILQSTLADEFEFDDFNTTVFLGQGAWQVKGWGNRFEHELKIGVDGDLQYLDHPPIKDALGHYYREEKPFSMIGWALGGKVWWSFAANRDSIYSIRFKAEGRPNFIDADRSTSRYRLRLHHTRYGLDRALQLKAMAGLRYDRAYDDPKVIKYDRLLPEIEASLRWRTPVPRLTALVNGKFKYNWYLNSRQNQKNSFRPQWVDLDLTGQEEQVPAYYQLMEDVLNSQFEHEYYSLARRDVEWEVGGELQVRLWRGGEAVLIYTRHQRISNIDDAPTARWIDRATTTDPKTGEETVVETTRGLPSPRYSYTRNLLMIELRQYF